MSKQARRFSSRSHRKQNPSIQRWELRDEADKDVLLADWENFNVDVEETEWLGFSQVSTDPDVRDTFWTEITRSTMIDGQHVMLHVTCNEIHRYYAPDGECHENVALWHVCIVICDSRRSDHEDWKQSRIFCQSTGRSGLKPLIWLNEQLEMVEKMLDGTRSILFADPDDEKRESAYRYLLRRGYQHQQWTQSSPYIKECW